jgi:hypothetical protein
MLQGKQGEHTLIGTSVIGNIAVNSVCSNPCQHRPAANASPCPRAGGGGGGAAAGPPVIIDYKEETIEHKSIRTNHQKLLLQ